MAQKYDLKFFSVEIRFSSLGVKFYNKLAFVINGRFSEYNLCLLYHFFQNFFQFGKVKVTQSCLTLCDPMD